MTLRIKHLPVRRGEVLHGGDAKMEEEMEGGMQEQLLTAPLPRCHLRCKGLLPGAVTVLL